MNNKDTSSFDLCLNFCLSHNTHNMLSSTPLRESLRQEAERDPRAKTSKRPFNELIGLIVVLLHLSR
jgi:hypothetical protein